MDNSQKYPMRQLSDCLDANFTRVGEVITKWKDDHIIIDVFGGDVQVWNRLNMRTYHKRFTATNASNAEGPYLDAINWIENEYDHQAQPIPEKWLKPA